MVVLDGERREVEVDLARRTVRVGASEWPVQIGEIREGSVSFELLGEVVEVRGVVPPNGGRGPVAINGELHSLLLESRSGPVPAVSGGGAPSPPTAGPTLTEDRTGPGRAVTPPMPGKVLEVRVHNGDQVAAGELLLVVEAMKMRNEVLAPIAGEVTGLRVGPGANVAARDVLLRVVPK